MAGGGPEERRPGPVEAMLGDVLEAVTGAKAGQLHGSRHRRGCRGRPGGRPWRRGDPRPRTPVTSVPPNSGSSGRSNRSRVRDPPAGRDPPLEAREIDSLPTGIPEKFVTVVPDRHGTGTNALVPSSRCDQTGFSAKEAARDIPPRPGMRAAARHGKRCWGRAPISILQLTSLP